MIQQGSVCLLRAISSLTLFFLTVLTFSVSAIAETLTDETRTLQGPQTFSELNLVSAIIQSDGSALTVSGGLTVTSLVNPQNSVSQISSVERIDIGADLIIDGAVLSVSVAKKNHRCRKPDS